MIAHAAPTVASDARARQVATFRLGGEWFGVDVLHVQEVMNPLPRTEVPRAPAYIMGLINVRGLIVTAISLKNRLGFPDASYDAEQYMNLIVKTADGAACLVVDEIGDVIESAGLPLADSPTTVGTAVREHIIGVLRMDDRLVTLLDIDHLAAP